MSAEARPTRVVVLADTHVQTVAGSRRAGRPVRATGLPVALLEHLRGADAILHAGDLLDQGVLDELAAVAPTWAVLGNNDTRLVGVLPHTRLVEMAGVRIGMIHDAGPGAGRAARMRRRFPDADIVVFGHSHAPMDDEGVDGQRLFNPGSPTQRRAQPRHTFGVLDLAAGAVVDHRIIALD